MLEITAALELSEAGPADALQAALPVLTRQLQARRAALFVRSEDGSMALRASVGLPPDAPSALAHARALSDMTVLGPGDEAHDRHGLALLCPIRRRDGTLAVLGLGPRDGGQTYGEEEEAFLRCLAAWAATALENDRMHEELRSLRRRSSIEVVQLHDLLDISRDLAAAADERAIHDVIARSAMSRFLVSRCAVYLAGASGLSLVQGMGMRREQDSVVVSKEAAHDAFEGRLVPRMVGELPDAALRRRLQQARMAVAVPLATGERVEGILALGERASGIPFTDADLEFAHALARQASAAIENARLQRIREEKQRQDRELQIAREIQRGLFPARKPELRGFELAAVSRPCYEVGGDCYDWIPLGGERLGLVIADVSGKGTPASLLMASVHASVRALAGSAAPAAVVARLNRFLFSSTQASRYVTLFYAELEGPSRRLTYVNAGHIPPFRLSRDGALERLAEGGPALGLLEEAEYDVGEVRLESGDLVAMVTDGVTEAASADERELGDEGVSDVLRELKLQAVPEIVRGLVARVEQWVGSAALADDLTALVLEAI